MPDNSRPEIEHGPVLYPKNIPSGTAFHNRPLRVAKIRELQPGTWELDPLRYQCAALIASNLGSTRGVRLTNGFKEV